AAESAGMQAGDEVIEVDGNSVSDWKEFTSVIQKNPNEEVEVIVQRGEDTETLQMTPNEVENELGDKVGQAGVLLAFEKSFTKTLTYGFTETFETSKIDRKSVVILFNRKL